MIFIQLFSYSEELILAIRQLKFSDIHVDRIVKYLVNSKFKI